MWVDGKAVEFDKPTEYLELGPRVPTKADLSPAAIGAAGGAKLAVSHLKLHRDIYYIAMSGNDDNLADVLWEQTADSNGQAPLSLAHFFSEPEFWRDQHPPNARKFENAAKFSMARESAHPFAIGQDEFFMLGDNSARSADGRLWNNREPSIGHTVKRDLMIGKALLIYWPHSFDRIPGTSIPFPMFPNFGDMKLVR